jgi:hypothetical protein
MDDCVRSLHNIIENLKQYYPKAILLFTPPLIPPDNEWYESGIRSLLRNPARSKQYAREMIDRASLDCQIADAPWPDGCQEHQDGVHFRQKGGSSLAEAITEILTKFTK